MDASFGGVNQMSAISLKEYISDVLQRTPKEIKKIDFELGLCIGRDGHVQVSADEVVPHKIKFTVNRK